MNPSIVIIALLSIAAASDAIKCYDCTGVSPGNNIDRTAVENIYEKLRGTGLIPDLPQNLIFCGADGHTYNSSTQSATCAASSDACYSLNVGIDLSAEKNYGGTIKLKGCQIKDQGACNLDSFLKGRALNNLQLSLSCETCKGDHCNSAITTAASVLFVTVAMVSKLLVV